MASSACTNIQGGRSKNGSGDAGQKSRARADVQKGRGGVGDEIERLDGVAIRAGSKHEYAALFHWMVAVGHVLVSSGNKK